MMDDELFHDINKTYTIRLGYRNIDEYCILENVKTGELKNIQTKIVHCKLNEIDKYVFENPKNYLNILKKYYDKIDLNDDVTIIFYK